MMAFVSTFGVQPSLTHNNVSSRSTTAVRPPLSAPPRSHRPICRSIIVSNTAEDGTSSTASDTTASDNAPIPSSFQDACSQASGALTAALAAGKRRIFVEFDTRNGDETYTSLTTSLPTARVLLQTFDEQSQGVFVLFPDAGSAALAKRDWGDGVDSRHTLIGIERYEYELEQLKEDADADAGDSSGTGGRVTMLVAPRASEVDALTNVIGDASGDDVLVVVNPDLVNMGVTGLSLTARRLRTDVIDTFDSVYYLRTFNWGVLLRCYPGEWTVWVDDAKETSGFRQVTALPSRPSTDELEEILEGGGDDGSAAAKGGNPMEKAFKQFNRLMSIYMKG